MNPPPSSSRPRQLGTLLVLAAATALLWVGICGVWPWISDDAFISLRYAARLCAGAGLTWTDGERVEGYSNLLWVLLSALLRTTGLDWVTIVRAMGIAATVGTFLVVARTPLLQAPGHAARGAVLVLAASAPVALWAIGGLEAPLALLLTTYGFVRTGELLAEPEAELGLSRCRRAGVAFALLAWTRPDGPLWGGFAVLAILAFARRGPAEASAVARRRLTAIAAPIALAIGAQLAFRIVYYGDYVPNTAHVKVASSAATLGLGLDYLTSAASILRCLLLPAALGAGLGLLRTRTRGLTVLCLASLLAWTAYTATIGGDVFPLCRILVPALGPLALLIAIGLQQLASRRHGIAAAWAVTLGGVVLARVDAQLDARDPFQQLSTWEWQGRAAGEWLGEAFAVEQPLLALDPAGAVPFYSRLPCLDMLGLCDRHIATAPLPRRDHVLPGHSRGDGRYVLDRTPDLVLFESPVGDPSPRWPGGWQMEADPRFLRDYRCVVFRTGPVPVVGQGEPDLKLSVWTRVRGRVGMQMSADGATWRVPAWLLAGHRQAMPFHRREPGGLPTDPVALQALAAAAAAMQEWWTTEAAVGVFDRSSAAVVLEVRRRSPLTLQDLELPAGDYDLVAEPPVAGLGLSLQRADGTACESVDTAFRVPPDTRVELRCTLPQNATLPLRLREIRLARRRER